VLSFFEAWSFCSQALIQVCVKECCPMKSSVLRCCRHCVVFPLVMSLFILCLQASLFAVQSSRQTSQGPQIYVQDSQAIKVNHAGSSVAVQALAAGNAQPLSATSADIDEDGVADLLAGYSTPA